MSEPTRTGESALPPVAPDCKKPEEAISRLVGAIHALPLDARHVDFSFGKRSESAGGGWYWGVTWTLGAGSTEQRPRPVDTFDVVQKAITKCVAEMARHGLGPDAVARRQEGDCG